MERNAGKLLVWAFLGPVPMRMAGLALGVPLLTWLADILFTVLIVSSIVGYVQRRRRRKREES